MRVHASSVNPVDDAIAAGMGVEHQYPIVLGRDYAGVVEQAGDGPGRSNVMATPTRENLQRLPALLADGTLRIPSSTPTSSRRRPRRSPRWRHCRFEFLCPASPDARGRMKRGG